VGVTRDGVVVVVVVVRREIERNRTRGAPGARGARARATLDVYRREGADV